MPSAVGPVQPGDEVHIIQACLNKLKPGNNARPFELRVMAFAIRDAAQNWTPQNLQQLVQVVVNKALEKAGILAEHCAVLSNALIPILPAHKQSIPCAVSRTHSHRRVDFRMLLLNAVQSEFQAGQQQLSATHSVQQSFSAYEAATPSQDSHSQRMLGLICFISHLFRQGLLTEKIVIACMTQMLQAADGCVAMVQSSLVLMGLTAPLIASSAKQEHCAQLDSVLDKLLDMAQSAALPADMQHLVTDIAARRSAGWPASDASSEASCSIQRSSSTSSVAGMDTAASLGPCLRSLSDSTYACMQQQLGQLCQQPCTAPHMLEALAQDLLRGALTAAEAPAATPVSCDIYARLIIDVHTAAKPSGQGNRTSTGGSSSLSSMQSCSRPSSASSSTCASPATSPSKSHNLSLSPQAYGEQPCAAGGSQRPASQGSESANLRRYLLNCLQVEFHNCLQALSGSAAGLSTPPGPFSPAPRATPPPPGDCSQPAQPSPLHRMGAAASSATQCAAGRTLFSTEGIYAKALKEIEHSEFKELPSCSSRAAPQVHCNEQVAPSGQCTNSVPLQEGRLAGSEVPQQQVWRDDAVSPACSVAAGREPAAQMRGLVRLLAALLKRQVLTARLVLGCAEQLLGFASSAGGGACALALCELLTCTGALMDAAPSSATALSSLLSRLERIYYGTALVEEARPAVAALLDLRAAGWQAASSKFAA